MKIGIFYGSTLGTTGTLAEQVAAKLGVSSSDLFDVGSTPVDKVMGYDCLLLGSSTWGDGELQDDWFDFLNKLKTKDLSGKKIGLFGCGDSESYPDTFCDAIAIIHDALSACGCKFIGAYEPTGYSVNDSAVCNDGKFLGLAIDDVSESNLTEGRLNKWIDNLKKEL